METNPQLSEAIWKIALRLKQLVVSVLPFLLNSSELKGYSIESRHQIQHSNVP